ncbi:heme-binding protein 2-like isoform X2 [Acropora millepora]|uniref:heme-binding protein 2-like isoform X2 n=1 Tax=Acropora millepora TaxID=45264 RepID=UPI001CF11964|nr:heme-binding protein 2-like isoform X2 [Acropora millepora]
MQSLVVLLALVGLSVVQARPKEPDFCHGLECPHFKTVNKTDAFELRCYETDYKWASTIVAGYEYDEAVRMGFMRLFNYIEGENVKKLKIAMTAPVAVEIQAGQGPFCKNNFTVNFFVPFKYQDNPVEPTSKSVFISSLKKFCAYVKSYGGYSNIKLIQENTEKLSEALVKAGLGDTFVKEVFFYAGYDSPFRVFDRHNEVWFIKKDSDDKTLNF